MTDFSVVRQYNFPTTIRFGAGAVKELPAYLKSNGLVKPLIVTDPLVAQLGFFKQIIHDLREASLQPEVFSQIHKNPVKSDVLLGADRFKATGRDSIIGLGGGAAMDVARAVALRIEHPGDLFDYDDLIGGEKLITGPVPHFVTIPTTSGTGSEVGRSAVISEDESHRKRILFSPKLLAKIVFADPLLTMELPPFITAATGMDALTHNMEAFLAKGFNPLCEGIALEGMTLIAASLVEAVNRPSLSARGKMMIASLMGAVAFQKGLGVVHSLAHPLSSLLDAHHGLANAINLPYGMGFNRPGMDFEFTRMARALGLEPATPERVLEYLFRLNQEIGLPVKLRDIGVENQHIDALSALAEADFCHPNNPKPVSKADFRKLYLEAL